MLNIINQTLKNIGIKEIKKHEEELIKYAIDQLSSLGGVTIYGNAPERCSIISFNLEKIHHYDAEIVLDKFGIAVGSGKHCAEPVMKHFGINGSIRISFAIYNTKEDIDMLIKGLKMVKELHK